MQETTAHIDTQTSPPGAEDVAALAKALAHPARVEIVAFLLSRAGCIAGDIVDEVGLAQSTVSEHLRILKAAGLITGTIEHPRICYSLNPDALAPLQALLARVAMHESRPVQACDTLETPKAAADLRHPLPEVKD